MGRPPLEVSNLDLRFEMSEMSDVRLTNRMRHPPLHNLKSDILNLKFQASASFLCAHCALCG